MHCLRSLFKASIYFKAPLHGGLTPIAGSSHTRSANMRGQMSNVAMWSIKVRDCKVHFHTGVPPT